MKVGLFQKGILIQHKYLSKEDDEGLQVFLNQYPIVKVILSSTAIVIEGIEQYLKNNYNYIRLGSMTAIPMQSVYQTPETLGKDRIAAVIGAKTIFPSKDCMVVDAGTCITYDLINSKSVYLGGNIAPGIHMRLKAMEKFTAALPLVAMQCPSTDRGYSTETAMLSGAVWGATLEVQGFIQRFSKQTEDLVILITGGDAGLLNDLLNDNTYWESHLVLIGLNKILEYNAA